LERALETVPGVTAIGVFLSLFLFLFALWDGAIAVGLLMRKPWGWWVCQVGLGANVCLWITSAISRLLKPEDWLTAIVGCIVALIYALCNWGLTYQLMNRGTRKAFNIKTKPKICWIIVIVPWAVLCSGLLILAIIGTFFIEAPQ
jgi:hypothetical protein